MIAKLIDEAYKPVQDVELPSGDWPDVILLGNRVFLVYPETRSIHEEPRPYSYREMSRVLVVPGALITS